MKKGLSRWRDLSCSCGRLSIEVLFISSFFHSICRCNAISTKALESRAKADTGRPKPQQPNNTEKEKDSGGLTPSNSKSRSKCTVIETVWNWEVIKELPNGTRDPRGRPAQTRRETWQSGRGTSRGLGRPSWCCTGHPHSPEHRTMSFTKANPNRIIRL